MAGVRKKPQKSGKYQAWYKDLHGRRKYFTGTTNRAETRRMAEKLEDEHCQVAKGYRPARTQAQKNAGRLFSEVREEYLCWGRSQGGRGGRPWGKGHARMRKAHLEWWPEKIQLETLGDLDGCLSKVERTIAEMQKGPDALAPKTVANRAEALKAFCGWCCDRGYLDANPLGRLAKLDKTPETRRRAMTAEEIRRLVAVAPEHRKLLYGVAFCSGLRAGELRALKTEHLDTEQGGLRLDPSFTKNRKAGFQPLPATMVAQLAAFAEAGRADELYREAYAKARSSKTPPSGRLLYVPALPAEAMNEDLQAAGIPKVTPSGKLDFHACRVAFITFVLESGASAKEAQTLARHSTVDLTMNTYARARDQRLIDLAERVGEVALSGENRALCVHPDDEALQREGGNESNDGELELIGAGGACGFESRPGHCGGFSGGGGAIRVSPGCS